jgi:hypothetical protein
MTSFSTAIRIKASPDVIWAILTDARGWTDWNTTVDRVEGTIALGQKVTVHAKVSPGRAFPVQVTEFVPGQRMVWTGGMPLGLFKGIRTYTLRKQSDGSAEFAMQEVYSGLMAPMITRSLPDLQPAFDEFAAALKARAEKTA